MKNTGESLKSAREAKNLSLHEIGMSLKINPKILQAIEEGDVTRLPPKTFLRGFVKSYAQFLKLDAKSILDTFDRETNPLIDQATNTLAASSNPEPSPFVEVRKPQSSTSSKLSERAPSHIDRSGAAKTQRTLMVVGGVFLVAIIVFVARIVNKYQKEKDQSSSHTEIAQPANPTAPAVATEAAVPAPATETAAATAAPAEADQAKAAVPSAKEPAAEANAATPPETKAHDTAATASEPPGAPPSALEQWTSSLIKTKPVEPAKSTGATAEGEGKKVATKTSEPPPEPVKEKPKEEEKVAAPEKTLTPADNAKMAGAVTDSVKTTDKPSSADAAKADLKAEAADEKATKKSQEVIIEASGKVHVAYSLGGGAQQSVELNADDVHTFKSKSSIALDISDGDAVNLIVNGLEKGKAGKAGQPVHLAYPKQ